MAIYGEGQAQERPTPPSWIVPNHINFNTRLNGSGDKASNM